MYPRDKVLLSARFDGGPHEDRVRRIARLLKDLGTPVFMVDVGAGQSYGAPTMEGLGRMYAMVAFLSISPPYGEKTASPYCTYFELKYANENGIMIIAVQLGDSSVPITGEPFGTYQNGFVFSADLVRIDARTMGDNDMASCIHKAVSNLPTSITNAQAAQARSASTDERDLREALGTFGLAEHAAAVHARGVASLAALLRAPDDAVEDVHELLEDEGAKKQARRDFRKWLAEERAEAAEAPPPGSESRHFYGLAARLNDKDTTGVEAATVLRVDIDPFTKDKDGRPKSTLRMAPGAVERQVQESTNGPVPVVSLIGPTGSGKSFVTSFFIPRGAPGSAWPVVASAEQFVPTSANVCLHRGVAQPSAQQHEPILLLDFEGEDGRIPKNLEEGSMRRLASYLGIGLTEDALKGQMKATVDQRQHVVKEVLPPLSYLISDIVVFVDQVEARRTERVDRVRHFAEQAHKAVESLAWRPVLLLVQNKWARSRTEAARYDVTSEYDWLSEDLGCVFSRVLVLRIPIATDRHKFEDGVLALHRAVHEAALEVRKARQSSASLYTEPEFWFGFETLVQQLSQRGVGEIASSESLSAAMSRKLASRNAADNAVAALRFLGQTPKDPATFHKRVREVLGWYAYGLAGQAWFHGDTQRTREELQSVYGNLMACFRVEEPCASHLDHGGRRYPCTQRRAGHRAGHRNPAFIDVTSESWMKRVFWLKDQAPCTWRGDFKEAGGGMTLEEFVGEFDRYTRGMPVHEYEVAFAGTPVARVLARYRSRGDSEHVCLSCLRAADDLTLLPDPVCQHYLCRHCILVRKKLSKDQDEVVCPFCARKSTLPSRPEIEQLRVLTLDGGGVRGLVEIRILQRLEERFAPLPLTSLFDLVVGTSAGGLISMALLAREPLARLRALIETLATDILDVSTPMKAYRWFAGTPVCDTAALKAELHHFFQDKTLEDCRDSLPYCCCTTYSTSSHETCVVGNFPSDLSARFFHQYQGLLRGVAHATAAAPTIFEAHLLEIMTTAYDTQGKEQSKLERWWFVDGGVEANCPAKWAASAAEELQARESKAQGSSMEMLVSIGTGRQPPTPNVPSDNVLQWAGRIIDMATDAERQWLEFAQGSPAVRSVPKLRVSPPDLGAEAAFSSASIPRIHRGMDAYFASAEGEAEMERLFHLAYAKLWQVRGLFKLVAGGEPAELRIAVRDLRFQVSELDRQALVKFVLARKSVPQASLEAMEAEALAAMAREAFQQQQQPLDLPMQGRFAYIFDGEDHALEAGVTSFTLAPAKEGMPLLNVVWRTEHLGDFPISGFPRLAPVIANEE